MTDKPEDFIIEKNIPIPEKHAPVKYPYRDMEVGDSFEVEVEDTIRKVYNRLASSSLIYGKKTGTKFRIGMTLQGKVRIWRIK